MKSSIKIMVAMSIGIITLFTQLFACGYIWGEDEMPESLK